MKTKISQLTRIAKRYSKSSVAIVLSLVMLTSAFISGSVLDTFAADMNNKASSAVDVVSEAVNVSQSPASAEDTDSDVTSDLSALKASKSVRSIKKDIEAAGANVNIYASGYSACNVRGSWDKDGSGVWNSHNIMSSDYTVSLPANTTYSFVYTMDNSDQFAADTTISSSITDYYFSKDPTNSIKLKTTVAGNYKFHYVSNDGNSIRVSITFPTVSTPDTWTVVGGITTNANTSDPIFGTTWTPTLTENDMTESSGNYTWSKSNVTLESASTIYYKVAKNHAWDTTVPSESNKTTITLNGTPNVDTSTDKVPAGTYNVSVTFDGTNDPVLSLTTVAKSTLTVASTIANTTAVTATYNGMTVGKGESIANIPQGATVNVNVVPDEGYMCSGITSTSGGTIVGSNGSYTLTMPSSNTTISATITRVTLKKIYFNNNYTQYGTVYAYVYNKSGENHIHEYLGSRPGKVMKETDNTEMWYIEVPRNVIYVEFISGDGKSSGELTIDWTQTNPKYIPPNNYDDPSGGTWDNYIWGDDMGDARDNVYTVSKGSTMNASNLFTGITATLYDYYTDGEIAANAGTAADTGKSGAPNGWLKGIGSNEYNPGESGNLWLPYNDLNGALSAYADGNYKSDGTTAWTNPNQPKYAVTYPLYFGNLSYADNASEVSGLYNYRQKANNSTPLTYSSNAVTGLSGKTLGDDNTIHYYKSGDTNENGAPMAMFNDDFLSGENTFNKPLAAILRTSSFPVRKTTSAKGYHKIYFDASKYDWWNNHKVTTKAHFWVSTDTSDTLDVVMTQDQTDKFIYSTDRVDSKYDKVIFYRGSWNNQTATLDVPDAMSDKLCYTLDGSGENKSYGGSWTTNSNAIKYSSSHDYYEFDSTNGKDNAYITNINKSAKTAQIDYYKDSYKTKTGASAGDPYGFFPFDYNSYQNNANYSDKIAHDLGFGMKLTIPFTLEAGGQFSNGDPQEFNFSGDDDLWVFVDGKLVLDLGGAHGRTTGTIDFKSKNVTYTMTEKIGSATRNGDFSSGFNTNENYVHTMTIYYMERGMFDSNLKFGFSFHAIPNQFWIDKKVRTKDRANLGHDTINSGFFTPNGKTGDDSNMTTHTVGGKTVDMSKFEKSFQDEEFKVTHWYGDSSANTLASGKKYTIDNDTDTHTIGNDGQYPIYHDLGNAFIGQFTTGQKFKLKETISSSNKYVYTPEFSVWDQANNDQAITVSGNNTDGYTFDFSPTTNVTGGIENTNIKARFENYMSAHDLTLTKRITNATDTSTDFTFQIKFDFTGTTQSPNYVSYPLYYDLDGERKQMGGDGKVTAKAGQVIKIIDIPEKAKIQITEVLTDTVSGYRYAGATLKKGGTPVNPTTITKGIQFQMGDGDMSADISNKMPDNRYTIKYNYPSYDNKYGTQAYTVKGVFTTDELDTYMSLDGSGNLQFKSDALKKNFINSKAPYEDNFKQTLSFADATINSNSWSEGNYTADVTATTENSNQIAVYFNLPYAVGSETTLIPTAVSGKVAKTGYTAVGSKKITYLDWYVTSGASHKTDGWTESDSTFVKAPLILYADTNSNGTIGDEGDTPYYFQYWSVNRQSTFGMKSAELTRCYDYAFNLALFTDCYIEPVYAESWAQSSGNPNPPNTYDNYERFDPQLQIAADSSKSISITFLENSRNQFNNDDGGSKSGLAADTIYNDFLLSFNNIYGTQQLNQLAANTKSAGIVIEAAGNLDGTNATGYNGSKDYNTDSEFTKTESASRTAILSWLGGGAKPDTANKVHFDVRKLDNKNCIQYYTSMKNRNLGDATNQLLNTNNNRYKVFRAYAFVGDGASSSSLTNITLSNPVYFTVYDIGKLYDLADNKTS